MAKTTLNSALRGISGGIDDWVYRSIDGGNRFTPSSATTYTDRIPLPPNWLYCADRHTLTIVVEAGEG